MNIKKEIMEEWNSHFGEYGRDDFGSCSAECETRWENIDKFFSQALDRVAKEAYQEGVEEGITMMADDPTIADKAVAKLEWNVSPSEEKEESGEKECECICHYTLQVLTTPKGATLRKECSHCSPKKEKRGRS